MKKLMILFGAITVCSCTTTSTVTSAQTTTTNAPVGQKVTSKTVAIPDYALVTEEHEVVDLDTEKFDKTKLQKQANELKEDLGDIGNATLTDKGIVITYERGDLFGLSKYVPSNNAQQDYIKLVKALKTYQNGTVIIAGKTAVSGTDQDEKEAMERAKKVARFLSKKDIEEKRILLDPMGVSFPNQSRNLRTSNKDRVVEFLIIPTLP